MSRQTTTLIVVLSWIATILALAYAILIGSIGSIGQTRLIFAADVFTDAIPPRISIFPSVVLRFSPNYTSNSEIRRQGYTSLRRLVSVMRKRIGEFLQQRFRHFSWDDFNPQSEWANPIMIFASWAVPACLFVLWADKFAPEVQFYQDAISEGVGPNLWNLLGSLGLFLFGCSIIISNWRGLRRLAKTVLLNTYAVGSLTFGLLLGQFITSYSTESLVWWKQGIFGVTSALLFVIVLIYNFLVWYLSFLLADKDGEKSTALLKLEQLPFYWRLVVGFMIAALILIIFLWGGN